MEALLDAPALAPPPGVEAVLSTYSQEQIGYYFCCVLSTLIPGVMLILRLYTKVHIVKRVDATDYLTIAAYLILVAMLGLSRLVIINGGGVHQWNLIRRQLHEIIHWMWLEEILYGIAISLIKAVILLQYQRLFAPTRSVDPFMWWSAWLIIVLVCLWNFISTWISIFVCNPREKFWNDLLEGSCLNYDLDIELTSIFNIVVDVVILLLPTRAVWKLSIPTKRKIAIISIFGIGLLACIANAMIILYSLRQVGEQADQSYNILWMGLWAVAEISLGLIVICALSMPKFVEAKGKKLRIFLATIIRSSTSLRSLRSQRTATGAAPTSIDLEEQRKFSRVDSLDPSLMYESEGCHELGPMPANIGRQAKVAAIREDERGAYAM